MIKDDFEYEGTPRSDIWAAWGNATCQNGKLNLPTGGDYVRSKSPFKLDEGAKATFIVASGEGDIFLSPYALSVPPNTIEGVPYYGFTISSTAISCRTHEQTLGSIAKVYVPYTLEIESIGGKLNFYVTGYDWTGKKTPRTLIAQTSNQFANKDVYVYMVGGALSVDSVDASSGSENPTVLALSAISQLIYALPIIVILLFVPKQLTSIMKETRE